jgi:peptidyl-prolyl cis-trans isomerase B (cyclophilin B)
METNKGTIELELYPQYAPMTVNNFVFLANEGFYDGVVFHRVIKDFVIQGGDPSGTGTGGPGYRFRDETMGNPLTHERGVISMANAGPNTNGSQFFIVYAPQPHLNGRHTVFGRVISGMDEVCDKIVQGDRMIKVTATAV